MSINTKFKALGVVLFSLVLSSCTSSSGKPNIVHKDPQGNGVVAKINGEEITEDRLIGDRKVDFHELKKQEYQLKMERIQDLMVELYIGKAAKEAGMSTEDFIEKKVVGGKITISDKDYKNFVKEKQIPENQIDANMKERINNFMVSQKREEKVQAYLAKATKGNPVEVFFKEPDLKFDVEVGDAPVYGKADAPVTIVEFSDFECPYCSRGAETIAAVKKKYGSKVRVAFKHFPLSFHQNAKPASHAAMCVHEQNPDQFWKFHDIAFKNQRALDAASLEKYAKESGADVEKYKTCMESKKYDSKIEADMAYGEKIGVRSTPTFFVNGEIVTGALPIDQFSQIIDKALAKK